MLSLQSALAEATAKLTAVQIDTAALDARLLLAHVTKLDDLTIRLDEGSHPLNESQAQEFAALIERRVAHEPLAYLVGYQPFFGRDFKVTPDVLIPRPDSETIIAALLALLPDKQTSFTVADLGVGSGCLLLSVLAEYPQAYGLGSDVSAAALKVVADNAVALQVAERLTLLHAQPDDWARVLPSQVNVMISNPPYIRQNDLATLMPDVRDYEPSLALDGGNDGLDAYRALIPTAAEKLGTGGLLLLEVGFDQAQQVQQLLEVPTWGESQIFTDLSGCQRVVAALRA